ncbi:MAG TPA: cation:proton antiporter [Candidatus Onthovivens sp.]|nr:cation:proton antiporter [Candidatus Onthovivens sp.]
MGQILCIALALVAGLLSTRLMNLLRLPNVTGYLIAGIIFGPFVLGPYIGGWGVSDAGGLSPLSSLNWISDIALGFIAFNIGNNFSLKSLKSVGKRVLIITLTQAVGACLLIFIGLLGFHFIFPEIITMPIVLVLTAIGCATAPAATLMVVKQYKARGPLVDTLLPVVALDDAIALIIFTILFSVAKTLEVSSEINIIDVTLKPLLEILGSIGLGAILGIIIFLATKIFKSRANRMIVCIAAILIGVGFAQLPFLKASEFELSPLLICMVMGAIYINTFKDYEKTINMLEQFTPPLYMLFFIISGASLDLGVFTNPQMALSMLLIGGIYIIMRSLGKYFGAYFGASVTKSPKAVKKYLGFTLLPQAGVAIGLATTASIALEGSGPIILATILTATLIYELVGPVLTKISLAKAGEIELPPRKKKN